MPSVGPTTTMSAVRRGARSFHGEHVQEPPEGEDFWIAYRSGADCHPDNNLMLFPYAVDPEPPPLQIVAVPIIVVGVEPALDAYYFLDPFYKSLFEVSSLTEISMRNSGS